MTKEYIERPSLIGKLTSSETQSAMREMDGSQAYSFFLAMVNSETAADVVEVKHGRWIWQSANMIECSCCGDALLDKAYNWWPAETPYRPNCGAKMDGKGEGE